MNWQRYIITFIITISLFVLAFYLSNQFANSKIDQVKLIQDKIATDILSTETRFVLLGSSSCKHFESNPEFEAGLNSELSEMAKRVKFMESQLGPNDERVVLIKDQYALFQIKDYLLKKQVAERCGEHLPTILYFHALNCSKCKEQSIVLDEIHDRYPDIRIYWFDQDSSTPAMQTLMSMFEINKVPSVVIDDEKYEGLQSLEEIESKFPELLKLREKEMKEEVEEQED
jgi:thiol-disulfide isomerase/thioredoxin